MELKDAASCLAALSQETRLEVFRLLVREGEAGLPAGEIAAALSVPPSTLSSHLGILERAGLLASTRAARQVIYRIDFAGFRALVTFLLQDCCQGRPEACGDAISAALQGEFATIALEETPR